MVVARSDEYTGVRALAAALLAFGSSVVLLSLSFDPVLWLPPVQIAAFVAVYWLAARSWVLRRLLPPSVRAHSVDRAARLAFL